jgi:hypothetical protein
MRKDIFRHNLLELLSEKYVASMNNNDELGYPYSYLKTKFNVNEKELFRLIAELFSSKEIQLHNPTGSPENLGICATNEGISSCSSKKYLNRHYTLVRTKIKDYVQIIIPILSLLIAYAAINNKIKTSDDEHKHTVEKLIREIETLKYSINEVANKNSNIIKK